MGQPVRSIRPSTDHIVSPKERKAVQRHQPAVPATETGNERVRAFDVRQDCLEGFARHRRMLEEIARGTVPLTHICEHCGKEPIVQDITAVFPSATEIIRAIDTLGRYGLGAKEAYSKDQVTEMFNRVLAAVEYEINDEERMGRIFTQVKRIVGEYGG